MKLFYASPFGGFAVLVIWQDAILLIYFKMNFKKIQYAQFFQNWIPKKT